MNVTRFVREHDAFVRSADATPENMAYHREVIAFVHRERLIHLLVTLAFGAYAIGALGLALVRPSWPALVLFLLLLCLLIPYIRHYFLLENHVQDWTGALIKWERSRGSAGTCLKQDK